MPEKKKFPKVSIVLVNYLNYKDTIACIKSLQDITYLNYEIIVVDNSENEESYEILKNCPGINLVKSEQNLGFAGGNNLGIKLALGKDSDYILLLNNDTVVREDFLDKLIKGNIIDNADLATGKIYYHDKSNIIWGAGGWINWKRGMGQFYGINQKDCGQFDKRKTIHFISGCMMLIKREVFKKIGFFDESYFMYHEDVDFCLRAERASLKLVYIPDSVIWHKVGATKMDKNPFCFYYFMRNSMLIIKAFANVRQRIYYFIYAPFYFCAKLFLSFMGKKENICAFTMGLIDGLAGNYGEKKYNFLQKN